MKLLCVFDIPVFLFINPIYISDNVSLLFFFFPQVKTKVVYHSREVFKRKLIDI